MKHLKEYQPFLGFGDFSDLYIEETNSLSIRWEGGRVDAVSRSEESGLGLRLLKGEETRFGHMDLPAPFDGPKGSGRQMLLRIQNQLREGWAPTNPAPLKNIPVYTHPIRKLPVQYSLDDKIALLEKAYKAAQIGSFIRQVNINYGERVKKVGYLNSDGESFVEERVYVVFSVTVTAERDGDLQNSYESLGGLAGFELFEGAVVERLAKTVAERSYRKLDAPQAPVGAMPVVIAASAGGTLIHEAIGHSLEADAVLEGTSPPYAGKLGKTVANAKLTVFDDPTQPGWRGSFHRDDEGVPSEPTKLIENGILKDYLFDRLSARKAGQKSNGHGRRESYAHPPIPRMSNTFIARGSDDPRKIMESLTNGLLVTKMGGGQVNTSNGDFVFEVEEGFWVKDRKNTLVRGATLLGNGPDVLMKIDQVGSDFGTAIGTCGKEGQGVPVADGIPTVHIKEMVVGGQ